MLRDNLERKTEVYWSESRGTPIDANLERYICKNEKELDDKSLLEAELYYAKAKGNIQVAECETLVLLVGLSLEPLLQSICVYKPEKVVLILNEEGYPVPGQWGKPILEDPNIFAGHLTKAVDLLTDNKLNPVRCPAKYSKIFETLVKALHNEDHEDSLVIDITGGKKSMVTSAFLYAAFSGARISYVDFESYSFENRRPYGFSCKIGELANPFQDFALREWEKVRVLYNRYQFNEALQMLSDIKITMLDMLPNSEKSMGTLIDFLDFYNRWDSGDFEGATKKAEELQRIVGQFDLPSVVPLLGNEGCWYEIDNPNCKPTPIYGDLDKLTVYVWDEMARIERLIQYNEDYRSAFLRAGGASEILMLGRLLLLVENQNDRTLLLNKLKERTPSAKNMFKFFSNPNKGSFTIGYSNKCDVCVPSFTKDDRRIFANRSYPMSSWWQIIEKFKDRQTRGYDIFLDMRNEVAHKYFPVPKEWAEEGLEFVKANCEDFMENHVKDRVVKDNCDKYITNALPWLELCELCGVAAFLTPNLRRNK